MMAGKRRRSPHPYVVVLAALFVLEWLVLAIRPRHRGDWALENALSVAFVVALALSYRPGPPHDLLYGYLPLRAHGRAHYTYSEVPYDAWARALTGHPLSGLFGWQRNHFDRLAHFAYGFLRAYPIREILIRVPGVRGFWGSYLPLAITMPTSADYELVEWGRRGSSVASSAPRTSGRRATSGTHRKTWRSLASACSLR